MSIYAKRVDDNQKEIVKGLRKAGYAVLHLHTLGKGAPDLLVSTLEDMWLVETKAERKSAKLNPAQIAFMASWTGKPVIIARSLESVILQTARQSA